MFFFTPPTGIVIIGRIEKQQRKRLMCTANLEDIGVQGAGQDALRLSGALAVELHTDGIAGCGRCTDLTVLRFPSPEYEVFKQGIVLGTRKARGERNPTAAGMLERDVYTAPALSARPLRVYTLPRISISWDLTSLEIDPLEAQRLLRAYSPLWQTPEAHYYCADHTARTCHPLLPPRKAHVATLTAAGLLNNAVIDGPAGLQVLKGSIRKQFQVDLARSDEDKTVMREQLLITIKVIDTHGIITTLT